MALKHLKLPYHGNFDKTEEQRLRRIRCIAQGFVLRKFTDPKVSLEEKQKLAEKIYLANIKSIPQEVIPPSSPDFDKGILKDQMDFLKGIKV